MGEWSFEHTIFTSARRKDAWAFWSDLRRHAEMEPGIEIELDGPFATGTTGRTVGAGFTQEWKLTDVIEERGFAITGVTADGQGTLTFAWEFEDEGPGTRMTHRIRACGPQVEEHREIFRHMEIDAPNSMTRLAAALDRFAQEKRHMDDTF